LWNDPLVAIAWPITTPLLSDKDRTFKPLMHCEEHLPAYKAT
jgi:dTDP-4-dehydrorhamnose 3,5-epimerase-like enzyme